ncbi:hypothetical protein AJ79_08121 [Helicocarpus griseus UAMH5409]|uniref:Uncharacterized protein n=1 Tax=Helicocarpus griseus UAMH5409 TaxID=1447875 RepID=A0A2B7WW33_9EURO|nr:hypothetical protein AJ79_08121 [Helicocarpus griseus UAMH5409]
MATNSYDSVFSEWTLATDFGGPAPSDSSRLTAAASYERFNEDKNLMDAIIGIIFRSYQNYVFREITETERTELCLDNLDLSNTGIANWPCPKLVTLQAVKLLLVVWVGEPTSLQQIVQDRWQRALEEDKDTKDIPIPYVLFIARKPCKTRCYEVSKVQTVSNLNSGFISSQKVKLNFEHLPDDDNGMTTVRSIKKTALERINNFIHSDRWLVKEIEAV